MSSAPDPEASPCDSEREEDTREGSALAAFPESSRKQEGCAPCHLLAWPTGAAQTTCRLQGVVAPDPGSSVDKESQSPACEGYGVSAATKQVIRELRAERMHL